MENPCTKVIIVNGEQVTQEQFNEMSKNPKIRLKKIAENIYKKLELILG